MRDSKEWTTHKLLKSLQLAWNSLPNFQNFLNCQNLLNSQQTGKVAGVVKIQFGGVEGDESGLSQETGLNQKKRTARDRPLR
jgi:hypothetical protein